MSEQCLVLGPLNVSGDQLKQFLKELNSNHTTPYSFSVESLKLKDVEVGYLDDFECWRFFTEPLMTGPASTRYHEAYPLGLLHHTVKVTRLTAQLYLSLKPTEFTLTDALCAAWLHDIGKCGLIEWDRSRERFKVVSPYYVLQDGVFKRNRSLPDHVELGQYNLMQLTRCLGLELPFHVWMAITYHNGAYNDNLQWPVRGSESLLMMLIHFCDMLASRYPDEAPIGGVNDDGD